MDSARFLYFAAALGWAVHLAMWLVSYFHGYRTKRIEAADMIDNFYRDYVISVGSVIMLCLIGILKTL